MPYTVSAGTLNPTHSLGQGELCSRSALATTTAAAVAMCCSGNTLIHQCYWRPGPVSTGMCSWLSAGS